MDKLRHADHIASRPSKQSGVALIVSLLLLIVITLLGISGMRSTTLEEKMAGNMRDLQMAFNAAESGLREGENILKAVALPAFNDTNGNYQPDAFIWRDIDWTDDSKVYKLPANTIPEVAEQPRFYIEEMPATASGGNLKAGAQLSTGTYRITVRAVGGSATSVVILQATFRR